MRAVHPDRTDRPVQATFTINRVNVSPSSIKLNIPRNYEKTIKVNVATGEGTEVSNLRLVYDEADQPGGVFPEGVHLSVGSPVGFLGSRKSARLPFTIWADNSAAESGSIVLKVVSDETAPGAWKTIRVSTHFSEAKPVLYFTPDHVETGVSLGDTVSETVVLENKGLSALNDLHVEVVDQDGNPAPSWVHLNCAQDQGSLPVGERREIGLSFSPPSSVSEGIYSFYLRLTASNYKETDIHLYVSVTQSGIGNVLFKVSDIYTGTLDANNQVIQGLAGARVKIQNENVLTEQYTKTTDSLGEAYFSDLPAGSYKCRVTKANHQEYTGRFQIKPGITTNKDVFLDYNLVTVEWEVNEITIEDKYEIVLNAVYETDVPAAVVVIEPGSVTLPSMHAGDVFNGEFTITNYGLIRADDITFSLPSNDEHFSFEILGSLPGSLDAHERMTIPYRVTCMQSFDQGESGGGCSAYLRCMKVGYRYQCSNGVWTKGSTHHCWSYTYGKCSGGSGVPPVTGGGGGTWYVGGGSGGGAVSKPVPPPKAIKGTKCFPKPKLKERFFDFMGRLWETAKNIIHKVGCTVNTVTRQFNDDAVDLSVKVPGGAVRIKRWFYNNAWHWEHLRNNLSFKIDSFTGNIKEIVKGGVSYEAAYSGSNVFKNGTYTITKTATGFRWEDKRGNWKEYDSAGLLLSYGNRNGAVAKLIYEGGRLAGIADRADNQVMWFEYNDDGRVSAVRDSADRRVEYAYTNGKLTAVTDVLGHVTTYEYDSKGRMTRKVDAGGRPTIITYDSYGNVSSVVDRNGNGHFFEFDYDEGKDEAYARITTSSGMVKEVWYDKGGDTKRVDINGRTVQTITKDGKNLIITDEKGNVTRREFDEWENLTKVIHPDGSQVSFEYDLRFNKVRRITDLRGNVSTFEYDEHGNLVRKVEAKGTDAERVTTFTYDGQGRLLTATIEGDANTQAATTTFTYDDKGNIASITDPEGNTTLFEQYDVMGNLLRMRDPRGNEWTFIYDAMGRLLSRTDPLGNTTSYEYDGANNRTAVINAYLKRFEFEYDDHNNLIRAKDPYGKYIVTEYNTDNLPVKVTDQEGKEAYSEYDNEGRLRKVIDGAGNETVYHYDESPSNPVSSYKPVRIDYPTFTRKLYYNKLQRLVRAEDVLDQDTVRTRAYTYDEAGNVVSETDEEGNVTTYEYDALNRLIKTTDPMGGVIERTYDDRGNLIQLKDANGNITTYEYDRNNRLTRVIRPMGQETIYEYDGAGNRTAVNDAKGQRIEYVYNEINRLVEVRCFEAGDHQSAVKTVHFTYDKLGNIVGYDDGTTSGTYTYDDLSRKVSETVNYGPFSKTIGYTYYGNGLKKTFTDPSGTTYTYSFDENNRLASIGIPGKGEVTYSAYHWNSPSRISLPGGSSTEYTYVPLMRIKGILAKDPGQNAQVSRQYEYSPVGNITTKETEHGQYTYQYDKLYRLIEATNPSLDNESYTYDLLGNRLSSSSTTGTWSYNGNNELLSYDGISFQYDANGNTIQKNANGTTTDYVYDIENRLIEVTTHDPQPLTYKYYYDPFGRRLWKEVNGERTYFVYSDEGLVGEYDSSGQEIRTYGWAPDSGWSTDPLFVRIGGIYYWYRNDHLGTPQKIVTTSGAVVWSAIYDSFGNCHISTETITNNLRFPGQYYDSETGLYYNLNRYYDPTTGRYLRADPFGDGINLYTYCFNNPLLFIDPEGLCAVRFVGGMVKGAASAAFEMFVYQPLAMVYDLGQIGYALITGDLESFTPYSDIGLAAWNGAGTIDILVGMVKGIGYVPIESGDPGRIGAATLNAGLLKTRCSRTRQDKAQ
ncbi:MAG: RHS domain-containing protein [Deltaproteobacteria bacterium]|nr:RHS domain-containing protein [Deltaproteobacteria bacterium]